MTTPLSVRAIESMRPGDSPRTDVGETQGLRVTCAKSGVRTFIYRYRSPERSEERRVGKSVDLGGRAIIKKKKRAIPRLNAPRLGTGGPKALTWLETNAKL